MSRASNATTVANTDLEGHDEEEKEGEGNSKAEPERGDEGEAAVEEGEATRRPNVVAEEAEEEEGERDIIMEFVMQDLSKSPSSRRKQARRHLPGFLGKRYPAVIRRPKKQRSRSLSTEKQNRGRGGEISSPRKKKRPSKKTSSKLGKLFHSVERLPTLSPFDEERILWMKHMEDDIALEEERRSRCLVRQAAEEVALEEEWARKASNSSSASSSSSSANETVYEQQHWNQKVKGNRKLWNTRNIRKNYVQEKDAKRKAEGTTPRRDADPDKQEEKSKSRVHGKLASNVLNVECFLVSRGWQLDQSRLLRTLDAIDCANFTRIQITTSMSRLVESVRPNLDSVVIHLGSQELMDAAHSVSKKRKKLGNGATTSISSSSLVESVAASIATVASRQIIKVAGQNRETHFVISLPLPSAAAAAAVAAVAVKTGSGRGGGILESYNELRLSFNATLKANCSGADNVHFADNEELSKEVRFFSDPPSGPNGGLSSAGMRCLARAWEGQLNRMSRSHDGQLVFHHHSLSSSAGDSSGGRDKDASTSGAKSTPHTIRAKAAT